MYWARYLEAFDGSIDRVTNTGFRLYEQGFLTYTQDKLGLSSYKQIIDPDAIHMNLYGEATPRVL